MSEDAALAADPRRPGVRGARAGVVVFLVVAVGALTYAKWWPYAHKTAQVLRTGTFSGSSSITGGAAPAPSWHAAWSFTLGYFRSVWLALVAALVIAAGVEALLPRRWLLRALSAGPRPLGGAAAGGLLALPSMMCTCCTAPIAVTLRRNGVRPASALAYWLGNPALNPAVLVFLAVLLPWQWVSVRIVAGGLLVFLVAPAIGRLGGAAQVPPPEASTGDVTTRSAATRFARRLGTLAITLIPEYVVVVLAVGAARPWLFPLGHHLASWGAGAVLLPAFAGALFVIPTAGEIPILLALLATGVGAGPAGALLLTLPALSLPSLIMVGRHFPWRVLIALFAAVVALGIGCGFALEALT